MANGERSGQEGQARMARRSFEVILKAVRPWLILALVCALFSLHPDFRHNFWTRSYLPSVLQQSAQNIVLAVGMSFVIMTGGIDLSVGAVLALSAVGMGMALTGTPSVPMWLASITLFPIACGAAWAILQIPHLPLKVRRIAAGLAALLIVAAGGAVLARGIAGGVKLEWALLIAISIGVACGLANGLMVSVGKVPSFVMTLGMMSAARGLTLHATDGSSVSTPFPRLTALGEGTPLVLITLAVVVMGTILLGRMRAGRYILSIGGNEEAARLTGVDVVRYKTLAYVLSGIAAAVGAILVTAKFGTAQTNAGTGAELDAIAAVVIGGTSLSGGQGTIVGALVGALTITVITAGLVLVGIKDTLQPVILGGVIVLAVLADQIRRAGR